MSILLYNGSIKLYWLIIKISTPFSPKAKSWIVGRKNVFTTLQEHKSENEFRIWIHVSSLGEFEQGRPIIESLKKNHPNLKIILTFFSPSGFEIRKNYQQADLITYLPIDTKNNAKKFIELVNPSLAIFIKYDFWFHYFNQLKNKNIPLILVSALFRTNQIFFKSYGFIFLDLLRIPDHIFVQNEESKTILEKNKIHHVSVIPDTRIDRVFQISKTIKIDEIQKAVDFKGESKILILGSSDETEENLIKKMIRNSLNDWKIIITPHDVSPARIQSICHEFSEHACVLWTENYSKEDISKARILIVDTIGLLNKLYSLSNIVFIGGGFNKSIHNLLEPASFGNAIMFGPNGHQKFPEAGELINQDAAVLIKHPDDFELSLNNLIKENAYLNYGQNAKNYINTHTGGSSNVLDYLNKNYLTKFLD